jgi:proteasome lid subunit RPN8/RPN11
MKRNIWKKWKARQVGSRAMRRTRPVLRFTPYAWAKLRFFCHRAETEIGGFGAARADDLLLAEDFQTVSQKASLASIAFEDEAVADFFDHQVAQGRKPAQFARIWCHTHPGSSPIPSGIDEETFQRVFGRCEWAVMFILAKGGSAYARLRFNVGPGGDLVIPFQVDFSNPFQGSSFEAWEAEYLANIHPEPLAFFVGGRGWTGDDFLGDLGLMEVGDPLVRPDISGGVQQPDSKKGKT